MTTKGGKVVAHGSDILSVQLHGVRAGINGINRFGQMLLWQLETFPNAPEVVVDVTEDMCLSACVSMETLELIWTFSERGDGHGVTLLEPVIRLPLQELKDPPHLFPKEQDFLSPASLPCASFGPLKPKL